MKILEAKIVIEFTIEEISALKKLLGQQSDNSYLDYDLTEIQSECLNKLWRALPETEEKLPSKAKKK